MDFDSSTLFFLTELIGTIAFSISGAMIAVERELDLFGAVFLGVITAIWGGIIRDVLLGQNPPQAFLNYIYLLAAVITALIIFGIAYVKNKKEQSIQFTGYSVLILIVPYKLDTQCPAYYFLQNNGQNHGALIPAALTMYS